MRTFCDIGFNWLISNVKFENVTPNKKENPPDF